jgi:ribosomal protein S18 acetylase RimI-like enzyme
MWMVRGDAGRQTAGQRGSVRTREERMVEYRITKDRAWLGQLKIGAIGEAEIEEVLDVVSRGMRDNPQHVAAFGEDPETRRRRFRALMAAAFSASDFSHALAARREDGVIVGVCGMLPPGDCRPDLRQGLRLLPALLSIGPRAAGRLVRWMGAWQRHDPKERHWHLGPLAVDAHLQGEGVGSRMMRVFCARMDAAGEDAYLETDKPINVRFYERFGFEVVGEEDVLGVPNWFMLRRADKRNG